MLPESIRQLIRNFLAGNPFRGEPDDAVWAAVRANDRSDPAFGQALCVLLERAGGPVYAVCRKLLGPGADAEDVFQDAVVALVRKPPRRATFAEARVWLCRVARNKAVDRLNQRNAAGPLGDDPPAAPADPAPHDQLDAVLAAVARLKESYRVPFQLSAIDGLTAAVIAGRLGITAETAQKRVERARAKVLRTLAGRGVAPAGAGAVLQSTLTEVVRAALPPDRAATLTAGVLAKLAALPARSMLTKAAAVLVAGLAVGGGVLANWAATREPAPEPQVPPEQPPAVATAITPVSYQVELMRKFDAGIRDRLLAALQPMAFGDGGRVELTEVDAQGPRLFVTLHVKHGRPHGFITRLRFVRDTWGGHTYPMYDFWGDGSLADYAPGKLTLPPHLRPLLRPVWGQVEGRLTGAMAAAITVVSELPADSRAAAEQLAFRERYRAAVAPLLGEWRTDGPRPEPVWLEWDEAQPMPLAFTNVAKDGKGFVPFEVGWRAARIGPDGRPMDLGSYRRPNRVSADGKRMNFLNPDGTPAGALTRPTAGN